MTKKFVVNHCITGAYAVAFYAEPRFTADIDIYISPKKENSYKLARVIKEFSGEEIDGKTFVNEKTILRIGFPPNRIEILNYLHGISDEEILRNIVKDRFGKTKAYFIGIKQLIKNKKVVKDLKQRKEKRLQDEKDYLTLLKVKKMNKL